MTVRSRLVMAFAYVSIITIAALMIPLALTLDRRARAEFERENIIRATTIAQDVGTENLRPGRATTLGGIVADAASQVAGRVIVVDHTGALVADSLGPATGQPYATSGRPEIGAALADAPTSVIRYSQDLGTNIMATAVPIVDERPGAQPTGSPSDGPSTWRPRECSSISRSTRSSAARTRRTPGRTSPRATRRRARS